jgi:hypothetical protein
MNDRLRALPNRFHDVVIDEVWQGAASVLAAVDFWFWEAVDVVWLLGASLWALTLGRRRT